MAAVEREAETGKPTGGHYHIDSNNAGERGIENRLNASIDGESVLSSSDARNAEAALQYIQQTSLQWSEAVVENRISNPGFGAKAGTGELRIQNAEQYVQNYVLTTEAGTAAVDATADFAGGHADDDDVGIGD